MTKALIFHAKRDSELVRAMKDALENIGLVPILFEYTDSKDMSDPAINDIRRSIKDSPLLFVFLTDNVLEYKHLQNCFSHEIGTASAMKKGKLQLKDKF